VRNPVVTRTSALLALVVVLNCGTYSGVRAARFDDRALAPSILANVAALGVATHAASVYVAMPDGLYWSGDPALHSWRHMNTLAHINLIAPNPDVPADVVFATDQGIFRSTDGGATSVRELPCALSGLARPSIWPSILYAATSAYRQCPPVFQAMPADLTGGRQVLLKSVDDGRHWSTIYRPTGTFTTGVYFDGMAADPRDDKNAIVGYLVSAIHDYLTLETHDGGKSWQFGQATSAPYSPPAAFAFDPRHAENAWIAWSVGCQTELDHNQREQHIAAAPKGTITNLAFDPVLGRLYVRFALGCGNPSTAARVYLLDTSTLTYTVVASPPLGPQPTNTFMTVTASGTLLTAAAGSRLVIVRLAKHQS
jgi:hypothetical protein